MSTESDAGMEALVDAALAARLRAYVPYSGFQSCAAVLTDTGAIHTGTLIENLIFGLAMCAERVALFSAVAAADGRPVTLAVATPRTAGRRTFPCGPCLQVAVEFGGMELTVVAIDPDDRSTEARTVGALAPGLPHRRDPGAGRYAAGGR